MTRHVYAKNRWHAVWVLLRETFSHPNTESVIHIAPTEKIDGHLIFHSETGTEGGYWAIQDARFVHKRGEPCFEPPPPDAPEDWQCWAYHNDNGEHAGYGGLKVLGNGDRLTIRSPEDGSVVWQGEISLHPHELFTEDAFGFWIHADQVGVDRDVWARYFFNEYPATLERESHE